MFVSSGEPVLDDTLVADNYRGADAAVRDDVFGGLSSAGDHNLIGDGTGMTGLDNGINANRVGTYFFPVDPLLGPLQDHGGPTPTIATASGSPARGSGSSAYGGDADQRGLPRVVGGRTDIGAFQAQDGE
jgi:hypothetical protein